MLSQKINHWKHTFCNNCASHNYLKSFWCAIMIKNRTLSILTDCSLVSGGFMHPDTTGVRNSTQCEAAHRVSLVFLGSILHLRELQRGQQWVCEGRHGRESNTIGIHPWFCTANVSRRKCFFSNSTLTTLTRKSLKATKNIWRGNLDTAVIFVGSDHPSPSRRIFQARWNPNGCKFCEGQWSHLSFNKL